VRQPGPRRDRPRGALRHRPGGRRHRDRGDRHRRPGRAAARIRGGRRGDGTGAGPRRGGRLPRRPPGGPGRADRGGVALDGDRGDGRRAGPAGRPAAGAVRAGAGGGAPHGPPGGRQAAACTDRPGPGARLRRGVGGLRRGAARTVRAGPADGGGGDAAGGRAMTETSVPGTGSGPVPRPTIRIGARTSTLSRTQSDWVAARLAEQGAATEFVGITTKGDVDRRELTRIGGTGVFAAAVREALLRGEIDLAVHSLKDLPTAPLPGVRLAAVPAREDTRDVL